MSSFSNLKFMFNKCNKWFIVLKKRVTPLRLVEHRIHCSTLDRARYSDAVSRKPVQRRSKHKVVDKNINKEKDFVEQLMAGSQNADNFENEKVIQMSFGDIRFDVQNKPCFSPHPSSRVEAQQVHVTPSKEQGVFLDSHGEKVNEGTEVKDDLHASKQELDYLKKLVQTSGRKIDTGKRSERSSQIHYDGLETYNTDPVFVDNTDQLNRDESSPNLDLHNVKAADSTSYEANYFDEQLFPGQVSCSATAKSRFTESESQLDSSHENCILSQGDSENRSERPVVDVSVNGNLFDEEYFGQPGGSEIGKREAGQQVNISTGSANDVHPNDIYTSKNENVNFFDEQYFRGKCSSDKSYFQESESSLVDNTVMKDTVFLQEESHGLVVNKQTKIMKDQQTYDNQKSRTDSVVSVIKDSRTAKNVQHLSSQTKMIKSQECDRLKNSKRSAFHVAEDIKQQQNKASAERAEAKMTSKQLDANPWAKGWDGKVDSRGFRILSSQVVDLKYHLEEDIVHLLKKRIIYEDEDIVAIDKPYGLASHGNKIPGSCFLIPDGFQCRIRPNRGPGIHHSVGRALKPLSQRISKSLETLHLVHRLDKETTGVMLLAKNGSTARELVNIFKKRRVVKKYWVLTKGVPVPEEGVIDIPMAEGTVNGKHRMVLRPRYPAEMKIMYKETKFRSKGQDAVTNFRVLSKYMSAALVECQPESGVKHQIRCHLAFGLNTPILGDHKYSHLSKLAPQKLHPDILQRLGIRQAKVRTLPMHLHAKTIILPEFRNGRNLFIHAHLPKYFTQNMKWLKIKMPD